MSTQEITIKPSRGPQLTFRGELVASAASSTDSPRLGGRRHEILVYLRQDGMWVVCIAFQTTHPLERPHVEVEVVDIVDDIETVMMFYEPTEHLHRRATKARHEGDERQLHQAIRYDFDELMALIREQTMSAVEEGQARRASLAEAMPERGPWNRLLRLLRIR